MNCIGITLAAVLANAFNVDCRAESSMSTERVMFQRLTGSMGVYSVLHNGERITSWAQVREVFDLDAANKNLRGKPSYPLEDHYAFISQPVRFSNLPGSEVMLVRTVPLQRAAGQPEWRYLIVRTADGQLSANRMNEPEIQAMFQEAGVPLPVAKPGLPAVEIEAMPNFNNQRADDPESREGADERRPAATPSPFTSVKISNARSESVIPVKRTLSSSSKRMVWAWPVFVGFCGLICAALWVWKRRV